MDFLCRSFTESFLKVKALFEIDSILAKEVMFELGALWVCLMVVLVR